MANPDGEFVHPQEPDGQKIPKNNGLVMGRKLIPLIEVCQQWKFLQKFIKETLWCIDLFVEPCVHLSAIRLRFDVFCDTRLLDIQYT